MHDTEAIELSTKQYCYTAVQHNYIAVIEPYKICMLRHVIRLLLCCPMVKIIYIIYRYFP